MTVDRALARLREDMGPASRQFFQIHAVEAGERRGKPVLLLLHHLGPVRDKEYPPVGRFPVVYRYEHPPTAQG